jgi:transposase, IS5 family
MSTDMKGIHQPSLFNQQSMLSVFVSDQSKYRVLENILPWPELAEVANYYRAKKIDINNGRILNLRLHLGAYIAQSMNGWTDRQTEEMVRYHVGVRILCGLEESTDTADRTRIEAFRNLLGKEGSETLNLIIVRSAAGAGFTGTELCASDTTVQESPIAYPTEVGHMKNISEKLLGIGKKLKSKVLKKLQAFSQKTQNIFTEIRLFTNGKKEKAIKKKKELSQKLHKTVKSMMAFTKSNLSTLPMKMRKKILTDIAFYDYVLGQIKKWLDTGFHPQNKILSLWEKTARAISKGKLAKSTEFGRRWIITRLLGGYVIGAPCQKLGADTDTEIVDEVLMNFLDSVGELPNLFIYDRGADSVKNDQLLKDVGVEYNGIFKKGKKKIQVPSDVFETVRTERSLTEATIAQVKNQKYNFSRPRARSSHACELKGQYAFMGLNLNNLLRDVSQALDLKLEVT